MKTAKDTPSWTRSSKPSEPSALGRARSHKAETRARVLLKSFREQPKALFALALLRAVKAAAAHHRHQDGFVEWSTGMLAEIEDWEERLTKERT